MSNSSEFDPTDSRTSTKSRSVLDVFCSSPETHSKANLNYGFGLPSNFNSVKKIGENNFFLHLDTEKNGFISPSSLLSYWERLGVPNGEQVLVDLGLSSLEETLDIQKISRLLNEEIMQCLEFSSISSVHAGIGTLQDQARVLRSQLESTEAERDQLRILMQSGEQRAETLAAEVDEQNIHQERECAELVKETEHKWEEIFKDVQKKAKADQEVKDNLIQDMQRIIIEDKSNFLATENNLKKCIEKLHKENGNLINKFEENVSKLNKTENLNKQLKKEISDTNKLRDRLLLIEESTSFDGLDSSMDLIKKVEEFSKINKDLKDRNDELETNLQILPQTTDRSKRCQDCLVISESKMLLSPSNCDSKEEVIIRNTELDNNYLQEDFLYKNDEQIEALETNKDGNLPPRFLIGGERFNQRNRIRSVPMISGRKTSSLAKSTCELNVQENTSENLFNSITDSIQFSDANQNILSDILKPYWNELNTVENKSTEDQQDKEEPKLQLEKVKDEIVKIISQKDQENENLKDYQLAFSQLNEQNITLKERIHELETSIDKDNNYNSLNPELLIENEKATFNISVIGRSSPDGQEINDEKCTPQHRSLDIKNNDVIYWEEKIKILEIEKASLETDRIGLLEKHKQLEESLEMMSSEFENLEDYWQSKLDEERRFYEEQLKTNESQFKNLEVKLKEYEDLLLANETKPNDESDRLSIIDETRSMEEEVNVWEEEISQLKLKIEQLEQEAENKQLNNVKELKNLSDPISLCSKRKILESSWMKIVGSVPKSEMTSVQDEMDKNAKQEVRRLQELRNYIQEECDQLLLRRDRLKEEVGNDSGYMWGSELSSTSFDSFLSSNRRIHQINPCDSQGTCCPLKKLPRTNNVSLQSEDLSSVAEAYRAVLQDITREISQVEADLTIPTTMSQKLILRSVHQRLEHQVSRCQHLQSSLALVKGQSNMAVAVTREQHILEISQLESLVFSSQELVRKQTRKYMDQVNKLTSSDAVLENLCQDNQTLMEQLKVIKERIAMN